MKVALTVVLALLLSAVASAQTTHSFTFGPVSTSIFNGGASIDTIDEQAASGIIQLRGVPGGGVWWGLITPQSLNFPNNGYNPENTVFPTTPGPDTLLPGSCVVPAGADFHQVNGCIYTTTTTVDMQGYAAGVTFTATAKYLVVFHKCTFRCYGSDGNNDADDGSFEQRSLGGFGDMSYTAPLADGTGTCPKALPNCKPSVSR